MLYSLPFSKENLGPSSVMSLVTACCDSSSMNASRFGGRLCLVLETTLRILVAERLSVMWNTPDSRPSGSSGVPQESKVSEEAGWRFVTVTRRICGE